MTIKHFTRRSPFADSQCRLIMGWGNGYVVLPKEHKWHGKHYDDLNDIVCVHGGLTFSDELTQELYDRWELSDTLVDISDIGSWVIGFDTAHFMDTLDKWTEGAVRKETGYLAQQAIDAI